MTIKELLEPLYHGTCVDFTDIDLDKSAPKKDFGRGFYTTNDFEQAQKFARLKAAREDLAQGYVITFSFSGSNCDSLSVKIFECADHKWFDFVLRSRGFAQYTKPETTPTFDIVIGPVANDAVGVVLNNFIDGVYGEQTAPEAKETAIRLLLTQKLHNQVFFGTRQVVDRLTVVEKTNVYLD